MLQWNKKEFSDILAKLFSFFFFVFLSLLFFNVFFCLTKHFITTFLILQFGCHLPNTMPFSFEIWLFVEQRPVSFIHPTFHYFKTWLYLESSGTSSVQLIHCLDYYCQVLFTQTNSTACVRKEVQQGEVQNPACREEQPQAPAPIGKHPAGRQLCRKVPGCPGGHQVSSVLLRRLMEFLAALGKAVWM